MKKNKFNIYEFLESRPLSWSAISSFEYDPEQWYKAYILGEKKEENLRMKFGKDFAKSCEDRKPMAPVTMLSKMEQSFKIVFNKIHLTGFADTFDDRSFQELGEYKTSNTLWTQKKVDEHGQLTLYALFNFVMNKVKPEDLDMWLECILTEETATFEIKLKEPIKVYHFKTKRTMADILRFGARITETVKKMQEYVDSK